MNRKLLVMLLFAIGATYNLNATEPSSNYHLEKDFFDDIVNGKEMVSFLNHGFKTNEPKRRVTAPAQMQRRESTHERLFRSFSPTAKSEVAAQKSASNSSSDRSTSSSLSDRSTFISLSGRSTPSSLSGRSTPSSLSGRSTPSSLSGRSTPASSLIILKTKLKTIKALYTGMKRSNIEHDHDLSFEEIKPRIEDVQTADNVIAQIQSRVNAKTEALIDHDANVANTHAEYANDSLVDFTMAFFKLVTKKPAALAAMKKTVDIPIFVAAEPVELQISSTPNSRRSSRPSTPTSRFK